MSDGNDPGDEDDGYKRAVAAMYFPTCPRCAEFAFHYVKEDKKPYCAKHAKERESELVKYRQLTRTL